MSVKWWRNLGDVQSSISGDRMVASGGERHVDTRDAQDLLARIFFSGSWRACMSTTELQKPGRWMAVMGILKVAVKITIT